ncbi:hypothetical protein BPAE_0115g00070 [Botrytis paeoniae]|uniref:Uncharacterized protein n=1 Tax=Botrytis paeoniae TaxID=278948 RepID=A0A4Z1FKT0_9HELO|nr:hypothetical protein BPAE_0115g00070 [Botrytis paeoniae]
MYSPEAIPFRPQDLVTTWYHYVTTHILFYLNGNYEDVRCSVPSKKINKENCHGPQPPPIQQMLFSGLICVDDGWMCWQATTQTITWQKHELNTARIKSSSALR